MFGYRGSLFGYQAIETASITEQNVWLSRQIECSLIELFGYQGTYYYIITHIWAYLMPKCSVALVSLFGATLRFR